ncbi:MAG: hypothetical protein NWF05_05455 [Candidatus Bathyarchaeota archaeon]|nr:hypothetical protein [Candidatus Bathyarchaeota archaeon]
MLKTGVFLKRRLTASKRKFGGDTQKIREKLIEDLDYLTGLAANKADDKRLTIKQRQRWAEIAASLSRAVGYISKQYDEMLIKAKLDVLEKQLKEAFPDDTVT